MNNYMLTLNEIIPGLALLILALSMGYGGWIMREVYGTMQKERDE